MRSASVRALWTLAGSFLRHRLRQPGTLAMELLLPVAAALWACLGSRDPAPVLGIGLPMGMLTASAWELAVLVEGGFWKRACASPAGGTVAFGAVALAALTSWLVAASVAYLVLLAGGAARVAGLPWVPAAVFFIAPAYAAIGLAVYAGLRRSAAAVTAAPFVHGLLVLLAFAPSVLEKRVGAGGAIWAVAARLSPVDLSIRLWRRACATPPGDTSALADVCLGLASGAAALLVIRLLLGFLRRREA